MHDDALPFPETACAYSALALEMAPAEAILFIAANTSGIGMFFGHPSAQYPHPVHGIPDVFDSSALALAMVSISPSSSGLKFLMKEMLSLI